jgi:hypothetical protein
MNVPKQRRERARLPARAQPKLPKKSLQAFFLLGSLLVTLRVSAQGPFDISPTWTSSDVSNYSTGAAWADINNDGWLDLVVANGNDMARQHLAVYYNNGSGTLPPTPDWESADIDYHGHLSVADVNKDGFVDVAVSVYLGPARFSQKGRVKLYLNNNGTLEALPSWVSSDAIYTFSCAFGDANGDGYPDLAVACGEAYYSKPEQNRVYFNRFGTLDTLPGWVSAEAGYSYDVSWGDFDDDGDLDLVFVNQGGPNRIYTNYGDSIGTLPTWESDDPSQNANSLFVADIDNDGYPDLAVSDNSQLGGGGRFKIYRNNAGTMNLTPSWTSAFSGYGSGVTFADVNDDGFRDLITGGWWQPCRIYVNQNGAFTVEPQWTSGTGSVVETIVCGDYNKDGIDTVVVHYHGDGARKLYTLPRAPLQKLTSVTWGGDPDSVRTYCYDLENGWISFAGPAGLGTLIEIRGLASHSLDLAVTNWDPTVGNYVFQNTTTTGIAQGHPAAPLTFGLEQNFPNPFNPETEIRFQIVDVRFVRLAVYDLLGREVALLVNEEKKPGSYTVTFDARLYGTQAAGVASGVYFYRLTAGSREEIRKMILSR